MLTLLSPLNAQVDSMIIHATPTTLEEFNYLTKGYKIQIESGLDMKKGYFFEEKGNHQIGNYQFTVKNLIRENTNHLAGVLIITDAAISGKTFYTAIPVNNAELMKQSASEIAKWDGAMTAAYCHLISAYLSVYFFSEHEALRK